jgi:hypothetical protein
MSEGQIRASQEKEKMTGGRPTWSMKADANSREAAAAAARDARHVNDPFGLFRAQQRKAEAAARQAAHPGQAGTPGPGRPRPGSRRRRRGDPRQAYKDLLKRCHPDMNGGDRSAEHKLQRVIKAYKTLQKSGLAK